MDTSRQPIRILIVDDHPVVRQGLRSLLSNHPDLQIIAEAGHAQQAFAAVKQENPDIVLLDIRLPGMTGIEVARQMHREYPHIRIIILTSYDDDEYLVGALQAEAQAYLLKSVSDETLVWTIRAVHRGERLISPELLDRMLRQFAHVRYQQVKQEVGLSDQDIQVLQRMAAGASNEEIARELGWSRASIKRKVQHIFDQLGVMTRAQAAAEAVRRGLV
ncbi:MAG TPA: response regulator transcription factor [Ktedonobacterales bacterium]|nr:response regulator transcription factor [Ktedonobacterales bacterium]